MDALQLGRDFYIEIAVGGEPPTWITGPIGGVEIELDRNLGWIHVTMGEAGVC